MKKEKKYKWKGALKAILIVALLCVGISFVVAVWDDTKSTGDSLTAAEWNAHVSDQKNRTNTATLVVAASDSSSQSKVAANYVCDGTDDQAEINNAINALPNDGGKVILLEGSYSISSSITIARNNTILEGCGRNTKLVATYDATGECFLCLGDGTNKYSGIEIRSLATNITACGGAHAAEHRYAIKACGGSSEATHIQCRITGCYFENKNTTSTTSGHQVQVSLENAIYSEVSSCESDGAIGLRETSHNNRITNNVVVTQIADNGIQTDQDCCYNIIANNYLSTGEDGIDLDGGSYNIIVNNEIYDCRFHELPTGELNHNGIEFAGTSAKCDHNVIMGNTIHSSGYSAIAFKSQGANTKSYNVVKGNIIINPGLNTTSPGIELDSHSHYNLIEGNYIMDQQGTHTMTYGIYVPSGASNNMIINNHIEGWLNGAISNSGTSTFIRGNKGYNPVGISSISVGTSPFTYTAGASPETVYVSGGTVTSITKSGYDFGLTSGAFNLEPHESIIVTYSAAPTMYKDVQ